MAREATEFTLTFVKTSLEQLGKEMTELTEAKIDMQAKIQQLIEQLDQAKDGGRCSRGSLGTIGKGPRGTDECY